MKGGKERLDAEYAAGLWDYLRSVNELPRFSVVAGYCHHFKKGGKILELGSGEGILLERLCPSKYSLYVGVDISREAINRAASKQDKNNIFVRDDVSFFTPEEQFDCIIFNECLEYFDEPLNIVQRYERFLQKDGIYIVSMFVGRDTIRDIRIWKMLDSLYTTEANARISTRSGFSWTIKVYLPLVANNQN
jgi:2-polyprenyl-3-methyl-5-hydroxy-6-metoxy-1,4-benzoquinol methylase